MQTFFQQLKTLFYKHRSVILYLFFGGCTTVINIVCYTTLYHYCAVSNAASTAVAWLAAVIFAFITNKTFVFQSKQTQLKKQVLEFISFLEQITRYQTALEKKDYGILTGILDVAIMVLAVDVMHWNNLVWKFISNVIVTILNYIVSKLLVFKK